jgi:3-hydroxy-9,10-secoandrosta-1,3,5(10)-triene-9,17-dione monooxygenase
MMDYLLDRPSSTDDDRALRTSLVEQARSLVPLLAANSQRTETERRIPEESIDAMREAGIFRLMQPRRFGGLQTDFRTKLEVTRELARGCGSTAWAVSLMNGSSYLAGLWPEQAQKDVWGQDPDNRVAGALTPAERTEVVDGGFRISGKWPFSSGCLHAQWGIGGVEILDGAGEAVDQGLVLMPMSDLTIEDTWHVAGMRGTGSNTLVADDVFVPEHRFLSVVRAVRNEFGTPFLDEVLYRSPFFPATAIVLAGPHLGLAQAALDRVVANAPGKAIAYTRFTSRSEAAVTQIAVAKAASLVDTAHLLAYRAAADIDEAAHLDVVPDARARARVRMDMAASIVNAREAIRMLLSANGASSFAESEPLQRIWRDSEVASRHAVAHSEINAQLYGQALLGVPIDVTPLV